LNFRGHLEATHTLNNLFFWPEKSPKSWQKSRKMTQKCHFGLSGYPRTRRPSGFRFSGGLRCIEEKFHAKFQVHSAFGWLRIGRERSSPGHFSKISYGVLCRMYGVKFGVATPWWVVTNPSKYLSHSTTVDQMTPKKLFA